MTFPLLSTDFRRQRLEYPHGKPIKIVLDTDTFNEIDDQFALAYAAYSGEDMTLAAVTAAPFFNSRSRNPGDGMEQSYQEILRVLELTGKIQKNLVFRGSSNYLYDCDTPVESEAAGRIVELAEEAGKRGDVLYILAIAAPTNVASALLMNPEIVRHVVVIWLGGHAEYLKDNREFNLYQDIWASRILFDSGVPLIRIPCCGVAELLGTNIPNLERNLAGSGELGLFLLNRTRDLLHDNPGVIKVIWDIATVAYFVVPEAFVSEIEPAPVLNPDTSWGHQAGRHEVRTVRWIDSAKVYQSMFERLSNGN